VALALARGSAATAPVGDWMAQLRRARNGRLRPTAINVDLILRHDPRWQGVLGYDEFSYRVIKRRPPPFKAEAGPWLEVDTTGLLIWFGRTYDFDPASHLAYAVVRGVAWDARFNAVRDWLEPLAGRWDGTVRLPSLLHDAFGAEQNEYTAHVGTGFLVTSVARIYTPGCKVDTMLVLESPQGAFKSTALIDLFGEEWYVDIIEPPSHKDFYITLQGAWCVEIGEMQSFSRADLNHVKQAITRRDDKFRAPYDKAASSHPRQSIFVGTTNDSLYLKDPTGGRRFLPVKCGAINLDYIRAQREQLFAEAIHTYRAGFRWWDFPADLARAEQEARYDEDSWTEPIELWLRGDASVADSAYPLPLKRPQDGVAIGAVTTSNILLHALRMDFSRHGKREQMRVAHVMRRLGWEHLPQQRVPGDPHTRVRPWRPLPTHAAAAGPASSGATSSA
jgi:predicted P-loop ATPase